MAETIVKIVECTRCQAPQVLKSNSMDSEMPVVLYVDLDGGYMNFIDNTFDSEEYKLLFCHACAHEFVRWANVPVIGQDGHQHTGEEFCDGWTKEWFDAQYKEQMEYIKNNFPNT